MRELERTAADTSSTMPATAGPLTIGLVGAGRVGGTLASALRAAGHEVDGPAGRGCTPAGDVLILCVPDAQIEAAAAAVAGSPTFVGHTSGATPLSALDAAGAQAFGLHPLQTIACPDADLRGCGCAVGGSTPAAPRHSPRSIRPEPPRSACTRSRRSPARRPTCGAAGAPWGAPRPPR